MRLDVYLAEHGICHSRSEAQRAIKEGLVSVNGCICTHAARVVDDDTQISLAALPNQFVSRGGQKLYAALKQFDISIDGVVALDIGASTGGFTDCMLQNGAKLVYALENGSGQLHPTLLGRRDVINMEHTNARYLTCDMFEEPIRFVTMDVSFISQKLILPAIANVIEPNGQLVSLIKPQFEVGRRYVGKGGIVRDNAARDAAVKDVCDYAGTLGFSLRSLMESPIKGGDGNTEFLAHFVFQGGDAK